jgi:D-3-phosphoglycerate dehydrogenase
VRPWIALAEQLGAFAGQLTESSITAVELVFEGTAATLNARALTQAAIHGLLKPKLSEVNMVNAPIIAKERGIRISEVRRDQEGAYEGYIKLSVTMDQQVRSVAGTVFSNNRPRLIQIKGIDLDAEFAPHMLYITNEDKPGFIGKLGTLLGNAGVNIANFNLGRAAPGADAICVVQLDERIPDSVLAEIRTLPWVKQARALAF